MSAARAVLSAEWRAVRQEAIALTVAIVALPLLTRLVAPGAAKEGAAWLVGVLCALLAALVLGAGMFAGEAAPAFRAARPMGPMSSALLRLLVRGVGLAAILALGTAVLLAWHPPIHGLAGGALSVVTGSILALLSAALASIFVLRPIGAAVVGALVAMVASGLTAILGVVRFQSDNVVPTVFIGLTHVVPPMLLALVLLAKRASDAAWDRAWFLRRAGLIAIGAPIVLLLAWVTVGNLVAEVRFRRAATAWKEARGASPPEVLVEESPDARRADDIARSLGGTLVLRVGGRWRQRPELPRDVRQALDGKEGALLPPIVEFLQRHQTELGELSLILADGDLRWNRPDVRGAWQVARLLEADARLRAPADGDAALRNVRAIRRLSESLTMPDAFSAVGLLAREGRLVRELRLEVPPPDWRAVERSVEDEATRRVFDALRHPQGIQYPDERPLATRATRALTRWTVRPFRLSAFAESVEQEARRNWWSTGCASLQLEDGRFHPAWHFTHELWEAPVIRARLEWELTALAARVRSEREAGRPVPAEMLRSTTCPGESWLYAETASGWRLSAWPLPWREQWPPLVHEELAP